MGGLGLRAALDHAPVAHAASLLSAQSSLEKMLPQGDAVGESEPFRLPEHLLDSISARVEVVPAASNWVEHCISDLGWSVGPFFPHENVPRGPQKAPKFCRLAIGSPSHPNQVEHG